MYDTEPNRMVRIFALQFNAMIERIHRYDDAMMQYRGLELSVVRSDSECNHSYLVTKEMLNGLKYAAFERFMSLHMLGATDIIDDIIKYHNNG
jgi:hypothetical protein